MLLKTLEMEFCSWSWLVNYKVFSIKEPKSYKELQISILGFYVPLYEYFKKPETEEEKIHNVTLAYEFLEEMEIPTRNQPSEIVNGDSKAILRIVYCLFVKYHGNKE